MTRAIAIFLPTLRGGGAERNMLRLAGGLIDRGYRVTIVVADARGQYRDLVPSDAVFVDLGVRVLALSVVPLARWLRRNHVDAVISAINGANVVALAAVKIARVDTPVVVSERNTLTRWIREGRDPQRRWIIPWLIRRLYPYADAIVAVSQSTADDLAAFLGVGAHEVQVTANPVVGRALFEAAAEPLDNEWRDRLGDAQIVVGVGRFVEQKNHEQLIRSFAEVVRAGNDTKLLLLGEGPRESLLNELCTDLNIRDHVFFLGFQLNPYPWMMVANVVVLTSRYEGLPTVLIEALACRARVVATDAPGGAAEILDGGRWGQLVPVDDVAATTSAIQRALEQGRWPSPPEEALSRYRIESVVTAHLAVVEPLIARREAGQ